MIQFDNPIPFPTLPWNIQGEAPPFKLRTEGSPLAKTDATLTSCRLVKTPQLSNNKHINQL